MPHVGDIENTKKYVGRLIAGARFIEVLAAVDAEHEATGSELTPAPALVRVGEFATGTPNGFPVCEVVGAGTEYDQEQNDGKRRGHSILVNWTQVGDDEEVITRQLERLVRATVDLLHHTPLPEIGTQALSAIRDDYSELSMTKQGPSPFVKGSQTLFGVVTFSL